jgi:hypothetical protein
MGAALYWLKNKRAPRTEKENALFGTLGLLVYAVAF